MTSPRYFIRALALVIVLAPALATTSAAAGRSIGQIIDDTTITAEIKAKLTADKLSNLTKIDVKSEAGVVTLGGTVDSAERRARAAQIASNVSGVKSVVNNIEVAGSGATASTPPPSAPSPSAVGVEVTGTVASVDATSGTITLQDGRVLKTTDQTAVWQPSSVGALKPGAQVLVRGATPAGYQSGAPGASRNWRMATVTRVDRSAGELVLNDGTAVKVTPTTHVLQRSPPVCATTPRPDRGGLRGGRVHGVARGARCLRGGGRVDAHGVGEVAVTRHPSAALHSGPQEARP